MAFLTARCHASLSGHIWMRLAEDTDAVDALKKNFVISGSNYPRLFHITNP